MFELFVQLDPALQGTISAAITVVVSFLILQVAKAYPPLGEYLGQYKVSIVTWLTGVAVQIAQSWLNQVPANWDSVASVAMQLIVQVIVALGIFSVYRGKQLKGSSALR